MARKGRIQVKKKPVRRHRPDSALSQQHQENPPASSRKARQVRLGGVAQGVPEDIIEELASTKGSVAFASVLQFLGAASFLGLAVAVLLANKVFSGGIRGIQAETLSANAFATAVESGAALIAMTVLFVTGARMRQFLKSIGALVMSGQEEDLEYVLGYLRGIWTLLGGAFVAMIAICAIVCFFAVK